jgi:hypothetical protein
MKIEEEYNYFEDILWIVLIVFLILAIGYYVKYYYDTYMNNQLLPSHNNIENNIKNEKYTTSTLKNNIELNRVNDVAPPKLVNLYEEDYIVIRNKNDIECTNRDNILLYDDTYKTDNESFDVELMRPYLKKNTFADDLENVYTSTSKISAHNAKNGENDEIYDYSLKPQKSDLPIANIPVYALLDNKSLKLSERDK